MCSHTKLLCELIHPKTLLENQFQGPMFIRGSSLFRHFYTVYAPILPYFVGRCKLFLLKEVLYFSVGTMGLSSLQTMHTMQRSQSDPMFIRGFPLIVYFYTFTAPYLHYVVARCLENKFKNPMDVRHFPLHPFITQTTTVWVHGTTVGQSPQKTTGKHL